MTSGKSDQPGRQERKERLAAQLRKNLRKRKAQARARLAAGTEGGGSPDGRKR